MKRQSWRRARLTESIALVSSSGSATPRQASGVPTIVYSSCNPDTLARDLAAMPAYRAVEARAFDMFPQTEHLEVMALLERGGARR